MPTILKCDIDFKPPQEWLELWKKTRHILLEKLGYHVHDIFLHPTDFGWHVIIHLGDEVDDSFQVNMLQFLLGDDHTRVKINFERNKRGEKYWNILFTNVIWRKPLEHPCDKCRILEVVKEVTYHA